MSKNSNSNSNSICKWFPQFRVLFFPTVRGEARQGLPWHHEGVQELKPQGYVFCQTPIHKFVHSSEKLRNGRKTHGMATTDFFFFLSYFNCLTFVKLENFWRALYQSLTYTSQIKMHQKSKSLISTTHCQNANILIYCLYLYFLNLLLLASPSAKHIG